MPTQQEIEAVLARARGLMRDHNVDALWARTVNNIFWLTQGANVAINTAGDTGVASILLTHEAAYILTDGIEAPRLVGEDRLEEKGFTVHADPWWARDLPNFIAGVVSEGATLASDLPTSPGMVDLAASLSLERARLSPYEQDKARDIGARCAEAMFAAVEQVRPGMSEYKIAALLDYETRARGMTPVVNLIATDERIRTYRHPLPTEKELDRYAMLVLCGRRDGIIISVTRLVHFGPLPPELDHKIAACARVDAAAIAATRPGVTLGDVMSAIQAAYAANGFADQWKLHHQGGLAGYAGRESFATPGNKVRVEAGQIYAWNPSITGVKCEDTVLVTENGPEVLTAMADWPMITVEVAGLSLARPGILVKDV